ncbi:hypothetical protein [Egbenema bharatensis]|uniref:hypothetical protein n=1 Tax=Egbenema bharatensis TaxID=3463334 RepID=UPI003A8C78AB
MSKPVEKQPTFRSAAHSGEQTLDQWIYQTIGADPSLIKFHRRGNNLHILHEGEDCPDRITLLRRLLPALQQTDLNTLIPADDPQIYQIQFYACVAGMSHPSWSTTIYLNQLESHLAQLETDEVAATEAQNDSSSNSSPSPPPGTLSTPGSALAVSNRSLARQGHETAIASYLSETLSRLGVAVRVSVRTIPFAASSAVYSTDITDSPITAKRLWVACDASYSPDPSLIGEAVTQKLRDLEITGYRDAVIRFQVFGETEPDWFLRVDLTPPEEMLREWARWGDVEAIQRLLNQAIAHLGYRLSEAALKEQTLHLVCNTMPEVAEAVQSVEAAAAAAVLAEITPLLESIAPQGIHAAAVYGQMNDRNAPEWVEWLNLPASFHPALSDSAVTLAQQGDWEAIAFLLHRLLNAELDQYLATGGIRLKLLPKQDLLHIMSESVVCPDQRHLGYTIARFLEPLKLPDLAGVRIYGRRSGQKHPVWSYGVDFVPRGRIVPEATPEFAATDAYVNELITPTDDAAIRPDLTPTDLRQAWTAFVQGNFNRLQKTLLRSRLFIGETKSTESKLALPNQSSHRELSSMLAWGTLGVLLVLQVNWVLAIMLRERPEPTTTAAAPTSPALNPASPVSPPNPPASVVSSTKPIEPEETSEFQLPELRLNQSASGDEDAFTPEGFTEPAPDNPPSPEASPLPRLNNLIPLRRIPARLPPPYPTPPTIQPLIWHWRKVWRRSQRFPTSIVVSSMTS